MKSFAVLPVLSLVPLLAVAPGGGSSCAPTPDTAAAGGGKTVVETAVAAGDFTTLVAAVKAAGLADALSGKGPFTVFAPTDAAFAALPEGTLAMLLEPENKGSLASILKHHVAPAALPAEKVVGAKRIETLGGQRLPVEVRGDSVRIGGADVVKTDIRCSNGVIHVIDAVLMPPSQDLVETAVAAGQFRTLAAALQATGLAEALKGEGPFTVFAPTDEAFAKLPAGTVESLLKPENEDKLAGILKLHVVPGRAWSSDLESGAVKTLNGQTVDVQVGDQVMVGGAKVVRADVAAKNGVIHVIDAVLLPKD